MLLWNFVGCSFFAGMVFDTVVDYCRNLIEVPFARSISSYQTELFTIIQQYNVPSSWM